MDPPLLQKICQILTGIPTTRQMAKTQLDKISEQFDAVATA
jgi:hypothetical protein